MNDLPITPPGLVCGDKWLPLQKRTLVMGIVNVTPNSFSDGNLYYQPELAVAHAEKLLEEGADILDIGGESTRPYAEKVYPEEELGRVLPVIKALVKKGIRNISIDTRNASTAQACLEEGASWLNDVSAFTWDVKMPLIAQKADAVILMHARGTPEVMQNCLTYGDKLGDIKNFLTEQVHLALDTPIPLQKIIVDPGVGFGKSTEHDLLLISHMKYFSDIGIAVLSGPSRKKFIGALGGPQVAIERDCATVAAINISVLSGADIVRVHNVKMVKEALLVIDAVKYGGFSA